MQVSSGLPLLLTLLPTFDSLVSENTCATSFQECASLCQGFCEGFTYMPDPSFNCPFGNQSRCVLYGEIVNNADETIKHTCWLKVRQESHYYVRSKYKFAPCQNVEPVRYYECPDYASCVRSTESGQVVPDEVIALLEENGEPQCPFDALDPGLDIDECNSLTTQEECTANCGKNSFCVWSEATYYGSKYRLSKHCFRDNNDMQGFACHPDHCPIDGVRRRRCMGPYTDGDHSPNKEDFVAPERCAEEVEEACEPGQYDWFCSPERVPNASIVMNFTQQDCTDRCPRFGNDTLYREMRCCDKNLDYCTAEQMLDHEYCNHLCLPSRCQGVLYPLIGEDELFWKTGDAGDRCKAYFEQAGRTSILDCGDHFLPPSWWDVMGFGPNSNKRALNPPPTCFKPICESNCHEQLMEDIDNFLSPDRWNCLNQIQQHINDTHKLYMTRTLQHMRHMCETSPPGSPMDKEESFCKNLPGYNLAYELRLMPKPINWWTEAPQTENATNSTLPPTTDDARRQLQASSYSGHSLEAETAGVSIVVPRRQMLYSPPEDYEDVDIPIVVGVGALGRQLTHTASHRLTAKFWASQPEYCDLTMPAGMYAPLVEEFNPFTDCKQLEDIGCCVGTFVQEQYFMRRMNLEGWWQRRTDGYGYEWTTVMEASIPEDRAKAMEFAALDAQCDEPIDEVCTVEEDAAILMAIEGGCNIKDCLQIPDALIAEIESLTCARLPSPLVLMPSLAITLAATQLLNGAG